LSSPFATVVMMVLAIPFVFVRTQRRYWRASVYRHSAGVGILCGEPRLRLFRPVIRYPGGYWCALADTSILRFGAGDAAARALSYFNFGHR